MVLLIVFRFCYNRKLSIFTKVQFL